MVAHLLGSPHWLLLPNAALRPHPPTSSLQEDKYLPLLSQAAREGELRELAAAWAKAKQTARLTELSGPLGGAKA